MADAISLEDELVVEEQGWFGKAITAAVILLVVAFAAAAIWYFAFREEETTTRATEDIPVAKKTINTTVLISGIADAELNSNLTFQSSGKVAAVNVKQGDAVRQGQVLAQLESDSLDNAVLVAQTNLRTAQLRLNDLLDGSTDAQVAAAQQGVSAAQAALVKAQNDQRTLIEGATPAEMAAAEQGVSSAQAQLTTATTTLNDLQEGASDADIAAAEAGVAAAESSLTAAENSAENAENSVASAGAALKSAETSYCTADGTPSFCVTPATPISSGDMSTLQAALGGANATLASGAIAANSAYLNAQNSLDSAEAAVASAEDALESAEAKLDQAEEGASTEDIAAAQASVAAAQAGLNAANEQLADLRAGADTNDRALVQSAVASAEAALASAQRSYDEALRGSTDNTIGQAREAVRAAQLQVDAAQIRVRESQILAPFDGTVAAVNITPGEFIGPSATDPPIVLLTPDRMKLKMDMGETDYPNVKLGQGGAARFDGLPTSFFPFVITEVGLAPTTNQGVVTYPVVATLVLSPDGPRPAPGMSASGQLQVDSKPDVIVVPSRAVRRRGSEQVVDVRRDGQIVEQVITTGISDNESVEVLTGVTEGEMIVVPALRTAEEEEAEAVPTIPGGIR